MYVMSPLQKMHEKTNQMLVKKLFDEGKPYHEIAAILYLPVFSVRGSCVYNRKHPQNVDQNLKLTTD